MNPLSSSPAYLSNALIQTRDVTFESNDYLGLIFSPGHDLIVEEGAERFKLQATLFTILGISQLWLWNSMLISFEDARVSLFENVLGADTISTQVSSLSSTALLLTMLGLLWTKSSMSRLVMPTGTIGAALCHLAYLHILLYHRTEHGILLLKVVAVMSGIFWGFQQLGGYALAASTIPVFSGWMSAGNATSGIITFGIYLSARWSGWFSLNSSLTMLFVPGFLLSVGSYVIYEWLLSQEHLSLRLEERGRVLEELSLDPAALTYAKLYKKVWKPCSTIFATLVISMMLYPNIAPLQFQGDSPMEVNVLIGIFQWGDTLGRYISLLPGLAPSSRLLEISLMRLIFVIPCLMATQAHSLLNSMSIHFALVFGLAITHGLLIAAALIKGPEKLTSFRNQHYRDKLAVMMVVLMMVGSTVGLWFSNVLVY